MHIKIENISSAPLRCEEGGEPSKSRPISWLGIEATVYGWSMMSRGDVTAELAESVDHHIVGLHSDWPRRTGGPWMELDEVCLLTVHAPVRVTVLFNTRAYVCNDRGDTVERIIPKRLIRGRPL
jgi:hypothetical protein